MKTEGNSIDEQIFNQPAFNLGDDEMSSQSSSEELSGENMLVETPVGLRREE